MTTLSEITPLSVHRLLGARRSNDVMDEAKLPSRVSEALHEGSRTAMMLGPAEWLVLNQESVGSLDPTIVPGQPFFVLDESDAWRLFRLQGKGAGDIVAQFCPIDIGAVEGTACVTHLARHPAIVMPRSSGEVAILVPRSYAASLVALIRDAITRSDSSVCGRYDVGLQDTDFKTDPPPERCDRIQRD
ncbi:MAG: hypothetical protein OXI95_04045 [bacterium]|nr:hypothetical protein [bacterium]MDE0416096.1 hypothetical protein [bacterium]